MLSAWTIAVFALFLAATPARAQTATPSQIQAQIAAGDTADALSELQTALKLHPDSGVAWYLTAEAQDAAGHESAARAALSKAQQLSPGLPFANQQDAAALQAHLNAHSGGGGISAAWLVIGGLVILFFISRLFAAFRRPSAYGPAYANPPPYAPAPGYGPGYGPAYGPRYGEGTGIGGALLTGLAAGAGIAAGERLIDDLSGQPQFPVQDQNFSDPPARDDGLQGNPGWDDNSTDNSGNFDPNNNW